MRTPQERFDEKYIPVTESGCWLWMGSINPNGYGHFSFKGKPVRAHIFAYEQKHGPVPDGFELDHKCRVRSCVNPDHVEPVTHQENVSRGDSGKYLKEKTHCKQGHPYSGENLYTNPSGRRECRICMRQRDKKCRENKAKKKQEGS